MSLYHSALAREDLESHPHKCKEDPTRIRNCGTSEEASHIIHNVLSIRASRNSNRRWPYSQKFSFNPVGSKKN